MGFHVILPTPAGSLTYQYVKALDDLVHIEGLSNDCFIYEGEKAWKPFRFGDTDQYANYTKAWFRAGIRAQKIFERQAIEAGFILQPLSQDQESFKQYVKLAKLKWVKRGDYIIRNVDNIEVDVKCCQFVRFKGDSERYFAFKKEDVPKHMHMNELLRCPVFIAVYQRKENTDHVMEDKLFMFNILDLKKYIDTHTLREEKRDYGVCYMVPVGIMRSGFKKLEQLKN